MREFLVRLRLPLLFATLLILTLSSMVVDRRVSEEGGRDHSWWTGILLEIAVPIQKVLTAPIQMTSDVWSRYVALVDVGRENETLRTRATALWERSGLSLPPQFNDALMPSLSHSAAIVRRWTTSRRPARAPGRRAAFSARG